MEAPVLDAARQSQKVTGNIFGVRILSDQSSTVYVGPTREKSTLQKAVEIGLALIAMGAVISYFTK